jgi:hypothetical protein
VLPQIFITQAQFVLYLVICGPRDTDTSTFGQTLNSGRDVDPVAVDTVFILDHIPKINSDTKLHLAVLRQLSVPGFKLFLDLYSTLQRVHHAGKL